MTRDDVYQVVYECSVCQLTAQVDDTSLARIADTFDMIGWGNVPEERHDGRVDYVVYCPKCWQAEQDEQHQAAMDEQASLDAERQGLW